MTADIRTLGLTVDHFKEYVLLEDHVMGTNVSMTADEAEQLIKDLTRVLKIVKNSRK